MDRIGERHGVHGLLYVAGCVKMPDARLCYDTALMNSSTLILHITRISISCILYHASCIMYHHAIQLHTSPCINYLYYVIVFQCVFLTQSEFGSRVHGIKEALPDVRMNREG